MDTLTVIGEWVFNVTAVVVFIAIAVMIWHRR